MSNHLPRFSVLSALCFALVAATNLCAGEGTDSSIFKNIVAPFLAQNCVSCHGPTKQKARLALHKLEGNIAGNESEAKVWETIFEQLQKGEMPPKEEPRPQADSQKRVMAWIQGELAKAATVVTTSIYSSDGNRLSHELLFSKGNSPAIAPATPARLWRISPMIYNAEGLRVARSHPASSPFSLADSDSFKDYASLYRVDEPETELLIGNAFSIADDMMYKPKKFGGESKPFANFIDASKWDDALALAALKASFSQILRRTMTDAESQRYGKLLKETSDDQGREKGIQTVLAALLLRPDSVFRFELGAGKPDVHGRVMLGPRELAAAISYALTDSAPDQTLLSAADDGKLNNRDEIKRQVTRLLNDSQVYKPRILRFFQEYFGYTECAEVFKDDATRKAANLTGRYMPETLVEDTDELILYVLKQDKDVLHELLTTNKSFVSSGKQMEAWNKTKKKREDDAKKNGTEPSKHPFGKKNQLFQHYNIKPEEWADIQPLTLSPEQRSGVLTQPSWLIAHSTNFENHAIKRGKWVRENLLGGAIPNTPITVDAKLLEDTHLTLRERMKPTRESFCWKCHQQMDPLGFPFEAYDHFGRFRTTELDKPVDSSGAITGSGDAKVDGPVKDAVEMMKRLASSERAEQVFVRHAFRFWLGRNETPSDAPTLQAAHKAYRDSGGSMNALIVSLLTSDSFLYRIPLKKTGSQP